MLNEQLEFQIAQYADGTLPAAEAAALEQLLATDSEARALLDDYRRLDASLKRDLPLPAMNWDRLASHLSDVVADEDRVTTTIAWPVRHWGKVAAAASIILVISSMLLWHLRPAPPVTPVARKPDAASPAPRNTAVAIVEITGPAAQTAAGEPVVEIHVGPSQWAKQTHFGIAEEVVYHPPRVMIASGEIDRQDTSRLPF